MIAIRRFFIAASLVASLAACISLTDDISLEQQLQLAQAEARTKAAADDYSQFLIARYAALTNDTGAAAEKYAEVAKARPGDESITEKAVFAALLANNFSLASSISSQADASIVRESGLPRLTLAADAILREDFPDVATIIDGSDAGLFNGLMLQSLGAWARFGEGDVQTAQSMLMDAAANDPYLTEIVLNLLGLMEVAAGQDTAAVDTFNALDQNGTLIATSAASYAHLLVAAGRADEAVDMLERHDESGGHNPVITALREQLIRGEAPAIERVSVWEGAALSIYVPAAALALQSGNDLAGVYYSVALELDPQLQAARALFADALDRAGRSDEAIAMLEAIPETSPFHTSATGQLAWALHRADRDDAALGLVNKTLADEPGRDLKIQMADLLRSLERREEALNVLSELIGSDETAGSRDWRLYFARGALLERMGEWSKAEADLLSARTLNPVSADVLNHLGYSWVNRGLHLQKGMDLIRRALSLQPESGAITDSLGWAHYRLGQYEQAVPLLERAVALEPGEAEIIDHLGDAYWMTGRRAEARFQWEKAISLAEDESEIRQIRRKMMTGPDAFAASQEP
jgi:tetratricopeptide (TPR) repeat protein